MIARNAFAVTASGSAPVRSRSGKRLPHRHAGRGQVGLGILVRPRETPPPRPSAVAVVSATGSRSCPTRSAIPPIHGVVHSPTTAIPVAPISPSPRAPERGTRSDTNPSIVGQK